MRRILLLVLLLCSAPTLALAEQPAVAQTNVRIDGKAAKLKAPKPWTSTFQDDGWGLRLKVPKGWEMRRGTDGLQLSSEKHNGVVIVFPHDAKSVAELKEGAREGIIIDGKNYLRVIGEPKDFGKTGIVAKFSGVLSATRHVHGFLVAETSKYGQGAIVLAVTDANQDLETYESLVNSIGRSLKFSKAKTPKRIKSWEKELKDTQINTLVFARSSGFGADGGGPHVSNSLILCSDGTFLRRSGSVSALQAWAASEPLNTTTQNQTAYGQWSYAFKDDQDTLMLQFDDGNTEQLQLNYQDRQLSLGPQPVQWSKTKCR